VLLYDRSSNKTSVNALRKHLFTKKGRSMENLPPTEAALLKHVRRAALQSGYYWHQCMSAQQTLPSPSNWGWVADRDGFWKPLWTTLVGFRFLIYSYRAVKSHTLANPPNGTTPQVLAQHSAVSLAFYNTICDDSCRMFKMASNSISSPKRPKNGLNTSNSIKSTIKKSSNV